MQSTIDIYIPFLSGSRTDELRYCLRSIQQYLTNVGNIYVISTGIFPEFNIPVIQHKDIDSPGRKEWNVIDKIRNCASGRFLFMNDDHYLLQQYNALEFPNYYSGTIFSKIQEVGNNNPYKHTLRSTARLIGQYAPYYDIHCPMIMDMDIIKDIWLANINYGFCWKTVYANAAGIEGIEMKDSKGTIRAPWFSTNEKVNLNELEQLYPLKSKYEL